MHRPLLHAPPHNLILDKKPNRQNGINWKPSTTIRTLRQGRPEALHGLDVVVRSGCLGVEVIMRAVR